MSAPAAGGIPCCQPRAQSAARGAAACTTAATTTTTTPQPIARLTQRQRERTGLGARTHRPAALSNKKRWPVGGCT